jgi:putative ABC transport system permease protein
MALSKNLIIPHQERPVGDHGKATIAHDLWTDVRMALRQYRRRPGFSILGIVTLALGIGASVSLFSVVRGTLIRPLPVPREQELQVFWDPFDWRGVEVDYIQSLPRAFAGLTAYTLDSHTLGTAAGNVTGLGALVTANFFDVLDRKPLLGHPFEHGADRPGAAPSVVISWGLWQRQFGGAADVIGWRLVLDGAPMTVIGVMPRDFWFPTPTTELWRPLDMDPASSEYNNNGWLVVLGRTARGASAADLGHDVRTIARSLGERFTYPEAWDKTKHAGLVPLRTYLLGDIRPLLLLLMGAVVALLLMACANVAALVLSRTTDRRPELALRTALGAGRGRLIRQIVAESLVLAVIASVVGWALAASTFRVLLSSLPLHDGLADTLTVDWPMFVTALGVAVVVTLAVAFAPARSIIAGTLRGIEGTRTAAGLRGGHRRFYGALVTVEIALGVLLASGALLLVRSVSHLTARDPGFVADGVVAMDLLTPPSEMDSSARLGFYRDIAAAAMRLPGIRAAGLVNRLPVRDGGGQGTVRIESRPDLDGANRPNSATRLVSAEYFRAMGIPIVRGRDFTAADRAGALPVAIVSESFASRMWPGQNPLGQRFEGNYGSDGWLTVVGVAKEARLFSMVGENPMGYYVPLAQVDYAPTGLVLVAKTSVPGSATIAALRGAVRQTDRRVAVGRVSPMPAIVSTALADRLQLRFHLSLLAALALILGAVGVYGVVSYAVSRRRAEFGVRIALGATAGGVLTEVARGGLAPVALGIGLGVLGSLAASGALTRFLYDVQPTDALSLGGAAAAFLVVAVLAVLVPGWRAARTSPLEVLRGE